MSSDSYWAAVKEDEIGKRLVEKMESVGKDKVFSMVLQRLASAYKYYYGFDSSGIHATSEVGRDGDQGELALVRVNHSRALVNTLLNLIVAPKVVWAVKATNEDYQSSAQTILAASILEYYWQDRQVAKYAVRACEEAIAFTEGFVFTEWDEQGGEDYAGETDEFTGESVVHKTGDIRFSNISAWDVLRDPRKPSWEALDWVIIRRRHNKYELAARFPRTREQILETPDEDQGNNISGTETVGEDEVIAFNFFHKKTASVPTGRESVFLADGTVLSDDALTYDGFPIHRVAHSDLIGTPFGYSPYIEALGIQELMDSLHSSIATNQTAFGTQVIVAPQGSELEPDQLAGGMRVLYYPANGKPPEGMNFTRTPAEIFAHLASLKKDQEQLFGLNSVVRGTPEGSSRSGAALALLQSQALQQASGLQANYTRFVESVGGAVIKLMQMRATVERRISISGKANRFMQREETFTGDGLSKISKVLIEVGNPLSQTAAGRMELAKEFIKMELIKTPEQMEQVLTLGRLEPLTQSLQHELMLIRSENESISQGIAPPVLIHDDALLHCREHRITLTDPTARTNASVLKAATEHIHAHFSAHFGVPDPLQDPQYREKLHFLMGIGPMPPPLPPPPMGMEGAPAGSGGPPPGPGPGGPPPMPPSAKGPPPVATAPPKNAMAQSMPNLPKNPSTGLRWNPADGGKPPTRIPT